MCRWVVGLGSWKSCKMICVIDEVGDSDATYCPTVVLEQFELHIDHLLRPVQQFRRKLTERKVSNLPRDGIVSASRARTGERVYYSVAYTRGCVFS